MKSLDPNNLGNKFIVENCRKVHIKTFLRLAKEKIKKNLLESEVSLQNLPIVLTTSTTHNKGIRYWFECPRCKKRVGIIYKHPFINEFGCRTCLNLKYKKSRFKGMVESI
jgi:hypothetical protein